MDSAFDGCLFNVGIRQCLTGLQLMVERFMEINHHNHAGFYGDSKERNVTDRRGDAEVVVKKPLQEQSSTHGIDGWEDKHERFGYRVEYEIQE